MTTTAQAEKIEFMSGVLLVSEKPAELARFYRDILGLPLEDEAHGDTQPHWGCTLGQLHFAIHPVEDFPDRQSGVGSVKLAFNTFDIRALEARLLAAGVKPLAPVKDTGFFLSLLLQDPDGNLVEFTELCDEWFEMLKGRRAEGADVVARWEKARGGKR